MLILLLLAQFFVASQGFLPNNSRFPILPVPTPSAGKIVGGIETSIERVPYQVAFLYAGSLICGGSIVKDNVVISAAHCVVSTSPSLYSFRAGSNSHSSGGQVVKAAFAKTHDRHNSWDVDYDISLIVLSTSFVLGSNVAIINLPNQDQAIREGSLSTASGWGTKTEGGSVAEVIRMVEIPIVNQESCKQAYGRLGWSITERMLCAGNFTNGGRDACQGDSGGPLVFNQTLIGITSWGYGCARPGFPGVWSRVPAFMDWVQSQL